MTTTPLPKLPEPEGQRRTGEATMKLSEAIEQFIDLKIEGEPKTSDWCSLDESQRRRLEYYAELEHLRHQIDKVLEQP